MSSSSNYLKDLGNVTQQIAHGNIPGSNVNAFKKNTTQFYSLFAGGGSVAPSVQTSTKQTLDKQGDISGSDNSLDIAVQGLGWVPVAPSGATIGGSSVYATRNLSLTQSNNMLVDTAGNRVLAWALDPNGQLLNRATEDLKPIDITGISGTATATAKVTVSGNLDSSRTQLQGAGSALVINKNGLNNTIKDKDIIIPEALNGKLAQGDTFEFGASGAQGTQTVVYGGIAITNDITKNAIYGANTTGAGFGIIAAGGGAPTANQAVVGWGIDVSIDGGSSKTLTISNAPSTDRLQFNSIQTLQQALQSIGLIAKTQGGRLYIAPQDANSSVTFANTGGGNLVEKLGLINIADNKTAVVAHTNAGRFSTLSGLRQIINNTSSASRLLAAINQIDSGQINISSLFATDDFTINGTSNAPQSFRTATIGKSYASDTDMSARASYTISAPAHGLIAGDWIDIANAGNGGVPNGKYVVTVADADSFRINMRADVAQGNMSPAGVTTAVIVPANATWQKIAAQSPSATQNINAAALANNGANVDITLDAAINGLVNNDIVYISGLGGVGENGANNSDIPNGYYAVTNVGGASFRITALANNNGGGIDANHPLFAAGNAKAQKVIGNANIAANVLNPAVMTTANLSNLVTLQLTNHTYTAGDYIRFTGATENANGNVVVNGIALKNNMPYRVTATSNTSITFAAVDANGAPLNAVGAGTATYDAASLGPNFKIDNYSQTFKYLSLPQNSFKIDASYNPQDQNKTLASNKFLGQTGSQIITVYDSLGQTHRLKMIVGKLGPNQNKWAVELYAVAQKDGTYDAIVDNNYGLITNDILDFSNIGDLTSTGTLTNPITINWNTGAANSVITMNLLLTQQSGTTNIEIGQDGNAAGTVVSVSITKDGIVQALLTNGNMKDIYQIPLVTMTDYNNGLTPSGTAYQVIAQHFDLKIPKETTSYFISNALEKSNAELVEQMLMLQELSTSTLAGSKVINVENQNDKQIINNI